MLIWQDDSMTLVYYREERQRHPLAKASSCTQEEAWATITALCKHWKVKPIKVVFHKKRGQRGTWSWYRMEAMKKAGKGFKLRPEHIDLSLNMLNYLTVAHEFAHYIHHHEFKTRRDTARAKKQPYRRERWHGPEHREITDAAIAYLEKLGRVKGVEAVKAVVDELLTPAAVADAIDVARRQFMATLPGSAECPKCKHTLRQDDFGVRVMKKDANGLPLRLSRQSYCKACRRRRPA